MTLAANLFVTALPLLISLYAEKYRLEDLAKSFPDEPSDFSLPVAPSFDFVIVGGGTAGCILANRLSEKYTVLLLEAGGTPPPQQSIPLSYLATYDHPDISFQYHTPNIKMPGGEDGGTIKLIYGGRMLGGSSSINGMTYERGHPKDYNRWAQITGDESWSYTNLLKYFKKTENYVGALNFKESEHGHDGPMHTQEDTFAPPSDLWFQAGRELGYNIVDSNGPQEIGFSKTIFTKRNGRRESTYTSYIKPIEKSRKNLTIYRYTYVSQVLFDDDKTAIGVKYERHGVPGFVFAKKEVILSAGTFVSALILIKSGIGQDDQLKEAKINPISILPVGQNLNYHPIVMISPIRVQNSEFAYSPRQDMKFEDIEAYLVDGSGPLSSVEYSVFKAMFPSSVNLLDKNMANWPDLNTLLFNDVDSGAFIGAILMQPRETGTIKLNSSTLSMADNNLPLIDLNYLESDQDVQIAVDGIKFILNIFENTTTFQKYNSTYEGNPIGKCSSKFKFRSDDYWKCYVRMNPGWTAHFTSTCRMGKEDGDPNTVVDSKLRVVGVKNLRVVDASVMPFVTNANTYAPTMVIAEKAAADILAYYANKEQGGQDVKDVKVEL